LEYAQQVAGHSELTDQVEQSRLDEQFGSGPSAGGSSSIVARGGLTSLLSAAIESGAITQGLNGNTVNLGGNVDGVLRFLLGGEPFPYCPPTATGGSSSKFRNKDSCGTAVLKDLGFSVSFDLDKGGTKTAATSGGGTTPATVDLLTGKNRFSGASLKYVFRNPRDIRSAKFKQEWTKYYNDHRADIQKAHSALLQTLATALTPLFSSKSYDTVQAEYKQKMLDAGSDQAKLAKLLQEYLIKQVKVARAAAPAFDSQVRAAMSAYMRTIGTVRPILEDIAKATVFSAEYNFQRPQGQPDISNFRVMSTLNPLGPNGTLSINVAGSLYTSSSVSGQFGRWRDAQAAM